MALLSRDDAAHVACVAGLESIRGNLPTSEAVHTEAMHLLGRRPGASRACLEFFIRPGAPLVPTTPARLRLCRDLMARYDDTPMDFADATLVALAEEFTRASTNLASSRFESRRALPGKTDSPNDACPFGLPICSL